MPITAQKKQVARPRIQIAPVYLPLRRQVCKKRYRGIHGGRGSGKSHFVGEDYVLDAMFNHVRAVCAREVQNSIKDSSKQLIEDKIAKVCKSVGDPRLARDLYRKWRITDREIVFLPTESLFIFRGLQAHTAASIKSLEGFNRLWIEEAQTVSQKSIELAFPTFRSGSQITATWNPADPKDPIDLHFKQNEGDPDFICIEANYRDNPFFPEDLRGDMERDKRRDPAKYAHVWLGKYYIRQDALVFRNWKLEEFETPRNARFYFGADWGYSVDPTVLIRCYTDEVNRRMYIDYEAHKVGCEIDNTPALFDTVPGSRDWPICSDSARPETISYMKRHGYPRIRGAIKGAGSVEDGLEFLQSYDIIVHPRCVHLIDELSTYSWKVDPKTNEILPVLEDKNNHVIDALRYALEATRRGTFTLASVG